MLGGNYFRLTDCFACFLAEAKCDKHVILVPYSTVICTQTLFGLPSLCFVFFITYRFQISRRCISAAETVEEQQWMHHVTHRCCHAMFHITNVHPFLRDRKSTKHYLRITLIDWFVFFFFHGTWELPRKDIVVSSKCLPLSIFSTRPLRTAAR